MKVLLTFLEDSHIKLYQMEYEEKIYLVAMFRSSNPTTVIKKDTFDGFINTFIELNENPYKFLKHEILKSVANIVIKYDLQINILEVIYKEEEYGKDFKQLFLIKESFKST